MRGLASREFPRLCMEVCVCVCVCEPVCARKCGCVSACVCACVNVLDASLHAFWLSGHMLGTIKLACITLCMVSGC